MNSFTKKKRACKGCGTICNLAKALNVEVWELFKGEVTADERKDVVRRLSNDVRQWVNEALDTVFRQYQG
jgi:hypothetical protein